MFDVAPQDAFIVCQSHVSAFPVKSLAKNSSGHDGSLSAGELRRAILTVARRDLIARLTDRRPHN
jgi:hypothetical protein